MKSSAWGCGCFLKVYVCPTHLHEANLEMIETLEGQLDQLELHLGTEVAHESGDGGDGDERRGSER